MGFRGNVGIDSMIYDGKLHPIVEINLRKTMGWVALKLGKSVAYETGTEGLLPKFLDIGKKITFQKQLKLL
jgi:predicted ATP-grasp superfamily ATP-dependent carboligase